MLRKLKLLAITGLFAGAVAACDRAPTEPALADIESLLAVTAPAAGGLGSASTLPALFRESISVVEQADGRRGVESLLAKWRELQEQLKDEAPAAPRSTVEARLSAIRAEELRVVHRVLGDAVITRIITDVNLGLAEARSQISRAQSGGLDITAAASMVRQAREKLAEATGALLVSNVDEALDHATQAAAQLTGLRYHLVELRRVPGLETLFPRAVEKLRQDRGEAATSAALARLEALETQARAALRSGNRDQAHATLAQVRAEQIRVVQKVLGPRAAKQLVEHVGARAKEARATLDSLDAAGTDVGKYERMLRQAVDLNKRAAASLATGDSGNAFDLGSHAAGLLNALQHLTWR